MSIAIDALKRLQSERARLARRPEASAMPEHARSVAHPHFLAAILRKSLRLSLIVAGLGGVGLGACLGGGQSLARADGKYPEHETETGKGINRLDSIPSPFVVGVPEHKTEEASASVTMGLTDASEDAVPTKTAPLTGVEVQRDVMTVSMRPTQSVRQSQFPETSQFPVSAPSDRPPARTKSNPAPTAQPSVVEDAPVLKQQSASDAPSSAAAPFVVNDNAEASGRQEPLVRPQLWNLTPMDAALVHARDLITQQRYAQAVTVLSPLFVTPPRTWEPWFWFGTAQLGLGQWEKARELFREGLARDAAVPQLWVHHALVSQQQGRPGEALESLRQAELLAPQLPAVQLNLAYALEVQGAAPVAVEHYRMFLALTNDSNVYDRTREKVRKHLLQLARR